jgi:flagellar protein FlgJ
MTAQSFVESYFEAAYAAFKKYGIHPTATIAQAAKESGWGEAYNATKAKNFFGMTKGSAIINEYWFGIWRKSASGQKYRVYPSATNSFLDFGRVIATHYPDSAAVSSDLEQYADTISQSAYLTSADNRAQYRSDLISIGNKCSHYVECMISKKEAPAETLSLPVINKATGDSCPLNREADDASGKEINALTILLWVAVLVVVPGGLAFYFLKNNK